MSLNSVFDGDFQFSVLVGVALRIAMKKTIYNYKSRWSNKKGMKKEFGAKLRLDFVCIKW